MSDDTGFAVLVSILLLLTLLVPLGLLIYIAFDMWETGEPQRRALEDARTARSEYVKRHGYSAATWDNWVQCGNNTCD